MGVDGIFFHLGHSQGCILSCLGTRGLDKSVQQQISTLLVAPACFMKEGICNSVSHIGSSGDIVSWADPIGWWGCSTYTEYKRHPSEVGFIDHSFSSQTFSEPLATRIRNQMINSGCLE
jgi:hypothetical protein